MLYNLEVETFKMHNSPTGALFLHNTSVKKGKPLLLSTSEPVHNSVYRNNLFIGSEGRAYDCDPPMIDCDFDYDGFGGSSGPIFLKWNNVRYPSLAEVKSESARLSPCRGGRSGDGFRRGNQAAHRCEKAIRPAGP